MSMKTWLATHLAVPLGAEKTVDHLVRFLHTSAYSKGCMLPAFNLVTLLIPVNARYARASVEKSYWLGNVEVGFG